MSAWWRCGRMNASESGSRRSSSDEHLVGRVAATRAVALHLPVAAELLGRVEVDAHVEASRAARGREKPSSPSVTTKRPGDEVVGRPERAVGVLVDGLHDRLVASAGGARCWARMSRWLQSGWSGVMFRSARCLPVVAVVVVGAEVGDLVLAEHAHEAARDRGLPGPGVADDAEHDRPRHQRAPAMRTTVDEARRRDQIHLSADSIGQTR